MEVKEQYKIIIWHRFRASGTLDSYVDNNSAYETMKGNTKIRSKESLGYCKLKQQTPLIQQIIFKTIRPKETGQTGMVQDPGATDSYNI